MLNSRCLLDIQAERLNQQVAINLGFRRISLGWRYNCRSHLHAVGPSKSLSWCGLETWSLMMPWKLPSGKA